MRILCPNSSFPSLISSLFLICLFICWFRFTSKEKDEEAGITTRQTLPQIAAASVLVSDTSFFSFYSLHLKLGPTTVN